MAGSAEILAAFRELSNLKQITREELHGHNYRATLELDAALDAGQSRLADALAAAGRFAEAVHLLRLPQSAIDEIVELRAAIRSRRGWVMDTYALRSPGAGPG